jgi:hypothetical protein
MQPIFYSNLYVLILWKITSDGKENLSNFYKDMMEYALEFSFDPGDLMRVSILSENTVNLSDSHYHQQMFYISYEDGNNYFYITDFFF